MVTTIPFTKQQSQVGYDVPIRQSRPQPRDSPGTARPAPAPGSCAPPPEAVSLKLCVPEVVSRGKLSFAFFGRIVDNIGPGNHTYRELITMQTTLVILKPDAVQRGLCGEILSRFERKGLKIVGGKFMQVSQALAKKHYAEHEDKPFFGDLLAFITASPVWVLAVRGPSAVDVCRKLIGATDGCLADPGTIRGDLGVSKATNMVHGSDSAASAERELAMWFTADEIHDWNRTIQKWIAE